MTIKAYTSYNERNNTRYYREFEIIDELPKVGDESADNNLTFTVKSVDEVKLDCDQGSDSVWDYDYYCIEYDCVDDEGEECDSEVSYVAILKPVETDDIIEVGGSTFKNVRKFERWVKETVKKYYDNIEVYLEDLDRQYMTCGSFDYEIKGFSTKSGNPELYFFEVNELFDGDGDDAEYLGREYIL